MEQGAVGGWGYGLPGDAPRGGALLQPRLGPAELQPFRTATASLHPPPCSHLRMEPDQSECSPNRHNLPGTKISSSAALPLH